MILEGRDFNRSLSTSLHKIFTNIAQLIRFNNVKKKRSEKIQNFGHSTKNESPLLVLVGLKVHAKPEKDGLVDSLAGEGMSITNNRVVIIRRSMSHVKYVLSTTKAELYAHLNFKTMYSPLLPLII